MGHSLFADRSERAKLRVTGPQRLWFLHQVLTQDFESIEPGEARDAAMITAHGRMTGYLECVATDDAVLCHFEPELRASLIEEIGRYVFVTPVELDDVSDEMGLVVVAGPGWERAAGLAPDAVRHPTSGLGVPAAYLWVDASSTEAVLERCEEAGLRRAEEAELEAMRIEHGKPRWGREMDPKTFPQEAGIDEAAVHYTKGCYLGQEAMAKIHFRGKVNRRLARLEASGPLEPGEDVTHDDVRVGRVTSAAGARALAMVRHTLEPGIEVLVGSTPARIVA